MSTVHLLKCHTPFFNEIELNNKRFEIRLNDRDYQEGDILDLRDFAPVAQKVTGRGVQRRVAYILHEGPFGLKPGYCSMSIQPLDYDATREAACVKFCAGIHIEALTLLNQADHPTLSQICEENQSLRKQLTDIKTAQQLTLSKDLSKIAVKAAHPEDFCNKCGGPNIIWFAPNELWNKHARDHGHNILCPICFTQLVEQHEGKATVWEVRPA